MLKIAPLVTKRLRVELQECSIGKAIECALLPETSPHACDTEFLKACTKDGGPIPDPLLWTLQERALAICHYLLAVHDEDFPVGDKGHCSDYMDLSTDVPTGTIDEPVDVGVIEGDAWRCQHLFGYMLEAIERLQGSIEMPGDSMRLHWMFGCMAAQLVRVGEQPLDWTSAGEYDDALQERMRVLMALPERPMAQLFFAHRTALDKLHHIFTPCFTEDGIAFLAQREAAAVLPPATFPADSCVSEFAKDLAGKSH